MLAFATLAAIAACATRPGPPEVLVGVALPLSGGDAALGIAFRRGCERAVAERNAAGGVRVGEAARLQVRLDVRDDRSQTPLAEQLLEEMAGAGSVLLLATPNNVRAVAQAVVAERIGRPFVLHPAISPGLPSAQMRWIFALPLPRSAAASLPAEGGVEGEAEARGYAALSAALAAIEGTDRLDPLSVRAALQGAR